MAGVIRAGAALEEPSLSLRMQRGRDATRLLTHSERQRTPDQKEHVLARENATGLFAAAFWRPMSDNMPYRTLLPIVPNRHASQNQIRSPNQTSQPSYSSPSNGRVDVVVETCSAGNELVPQCRLRPPPSLVPQVFVLFPPTNSPCRFILVWMDDVCAASHPLRFPKISAFSSTRVGAKREPFHTGASSISQYDKAMQQEIEYQKPVSFSKEDQCE